MEEKIQQIQKDYLGKIQKANSLKELDDIFLALFGKSGEITLLPKQFSTLSSDEKKKVGPLFNSTKHKLETAIGTRRQEIREESYTQLKNEQFSLQPSRLQRKKRQGYLHPMTKFKQEVVELFKGLGFQEFDGPHIELDKYDFELINIPKDHPSRDLWDTLYLDPKQTGRKMGEVLLNTQTTSFQLRAFEKMTPPIRIMTFNHVFRRDNPDPRHTHTFDQFEIMMVGAKGEKVTMANLKYLSDFFLQNILGKKSRSRFRPKYYPFVEPGVGIDALCIFCEGKGCKVCAGVGWIEIGGAGMIHPQIFKNAGLDPKDYSGLAWGFGPARMLMVKNGIEDVRVFWDSNLNFLEKY